MSRLTDKDSYCFVTCADDYKGTESIDEDCKLYKACFERKMYDKLKHYEDLEEAGRLITLPCKAGDKLWAISESKVEECRAVEFNISDYGCSVMTEHDCGYDCEGCPFGSLRQDYSGEYSCEGEYGTGFFNVADFGKTVFLTKAEAEAKLAELKGGAE